MAGGERGAGGGGGGGGGGSNGSSSSSSSVSGASESREHLFKVLVIGELGVGKTSIIKRYVHQLFSQHYRATIGVDFALKVLPWDSRTLVRLQLWDIAGQERFGNMTRVYYKEAVGAFVVFDVTRGSTFEAVSKWKHDLDSKVLLPNGSPIPAVLLANKCDQKKDSGPNASQMDQFCKDGGFVGWFETSAKDNINIDEAARFLVENILANLKAFPNEENDVGKLKLDSDTLKAESKFQCC
ncbi:ras-related protein Rab-32 [Anolis sagrei]|uniref:ras-related protein Rab-32 n=1 Tax=Anolis sagrei TaxID=38937 RepID=UPI0035230604